MNLTTNLIALKRVQKESPEDVEYIREIRNAFVGKDIYPTDRIIEPEEHFTWFKSLDTKRDFFFIIQNRQNQSRLGILGCSQTGRPSGTGEIMIYTHGELDSVLVPFHAMSLLLEFMFSELDLDRAYGKFFKKNHRAIRFNSYFGFSPCDEDSSILHTELKKDNYFNIKERFTRFTKTS